jgi:moderate conductance mechanosensitive channel
MSGRFVKPFAFCVLVLASLFLWTEVAPAKDKSAATLFPSTGSKKTSDKSDKALPEIPENLDQAKINEIVAGLSDDQIRRLLLRELEKSAAANVRSEEGKSATGLALVVQKVEENISLFHNRLKDIRSGAVSVPEFLPKAYANLRGKGGTSNIVFMFAAVLALFAAGLGAEWAFGRYTAVMRNRFLSSPPAHWTVKIKRLALVAIIDFISICVFTLGTLVVFFLFFNYGPAARLVLMTYLVVVLLIMGILLLSRFFLSPATPALRVVPLPDATAISTHRWILIFAAVLGAGFLVRSLLELQGVSEETVVFVRALNGALILSMILYLVFHNREKVARLICHWSPDQAAGINLFRAQLAAFWHLLAIPYILLIWGLWVFYLLVDRYDLVVPIFAALSFLPLFAILDWLGQKFLSTLFGLVDKPETTPEQCEVEEAADDEKGAAPSDQKGEATIPQVSRFIPIIRRCLRLCIVGVLFFWILQLWGFEVRVGEEITGGAIKILLIVSLAYVAWRLIEAAINRKLIEVQGSLQIDEDSDAGGTGGSRIGTLLQIFRKFLLVVLLVTACLIILSAIGIDIKPLLAGAGILGLAIGLGTQNLIKDIVSGLFFLMEDAFRIGDYVESGKAKGTVEAITLRSLKLRHNRGMVHNVPFSQLGSVTNFSRDYNITKLDIRVPFGTDIDKVRKIVKKINKEIDQDEELAPTLLGPIKSMGVNAFDDSALIVRVKFKTMPGMGSLVQRRFFKRLKEMFDESGLEFATRHVMVRLPEDSALLKHDAEGETPLPSAPSSRQGLLSAAAGAAIATALAEEEARKKLLEQEGEPE